MDGESKKASGMGKGRVGGWSDGGRDDQIVRKENIGCAVILGIGGGDICFR